MTPKEILLARLGDGNAITTTSGERWNWVDYARYLARLDVTVTATPRRCAAGSGASGIPQMDELRAEVTSWRQKCAELEKRTEDLDSARYKAEREAADLRERYAWLEGQMSWRFGMRDERGEDEPLTCETCEQLAALRSQLAIAEERRRPARHRPGAVVNVGWDPEGD